MRLLYTSLHLEHPAAGGPQLRIENSIKALSQVCELDIISRSCGSSEALKITQDFFQPYCGEYHISPQFLSKSLSTPISRVFNKILNRIVFNRNIREDASFIIDHIDRREIDVLWVGYGNISYPLIKLINDLRPNLKIVCDTDSVWSRFVLREAPFASGKRKRQIVKSGKEKQEEERAWVNLCNVTTAVSEVDADYYRSLASDEKCIKLFSNAIDLETYKSPPSPPEGFHNPSIYLAGSYGKSTSSMNMATQWVLDKVLPLVLNAYPSIHFYIVGNNSDIGFGHLNSPNITVTGRLETVLPYLCNTNVALVPLKFESGTRFKILEAGACKVPIVSTILGAEGIPVTDNKDILLADEPEDFANAIIKILEDEDLAQSLAANCHELINKHYSIDTLADEAKHILGVLQNA